MTGRVVRSSRETFGFRGGPLRGLPGRLGRLSLALVALQACEQGSNYVLDKKSEPEKRGVWAPESDVIQITIKDAVLFGNLLMVSPEVKNGGKEEILLRGSSCMIGEVRAPMATKIDASNAGRKTSGPNSGTRIAVNRETRLYLSYRLETISPPIPERVVVILEWEMKGRPLHQEVPLRLATP